MISSQISEVLQKVADYFQIGKVLSYKKLGGNTNKNYFIVTENGEFICKILDQFQSKNAKREMLFLEHIKKYSISTTDFIKNTSGNGVYESREVTAVVLMKNQGVHPRRTVDTCRKLGIFLAKLHEVPIKTLKESQKKNFAKKSHWLMPSYLSGAIATLKQHKNLFPRQAKIMIDAYEKIKQIDIASHEQRIIHGDLYLGNVLFKNNKITVVLDWENVGIGSALLDFARSALALSIPKTKFHPELFRAFLAGYTALRPFAYTNKQLAAAITYTYLTRATWMLLQFGLYHPNKQKMHQYRDFFRPLPDKLFFD